MLGKAIKTVCPSPPSRFSMELGLSAASTAAGADLLFQVVAARYESGSIVLTTNRPFREWGALFDVDNSDLQQTASIDRLKICITGRRSLFKERVIE